MVLLPHVSVRSCMSSPYYLLHRVLHVCLERLIARCKVRDGGKYVGTLRGGKYVGTRSETKSQLLASDDMYPVSSNLEVLQEYACTKYEVYSSLFLFPICLISLPGF